jgi:hypothetical protein
VLVYAGQKWWRQRGVDVGGQKAKIQLGNDQTKKGEKFTIVAVTPEERLVGQAYLSLPKYRTKSQDFTLVRA